MSTETPWVAGPAEILAYTTRLIEEDSDSGRRLAMILADNAVELTIRTFLSLPKRITGVKVPRKELQDSAESFPGLLDCLERYAGNQLQGVDLGVIEWHHQLRNQLYHHGNGLTVAADTVQVYVELAKLLFKNLFGSELAVPGDDASRKLGRFLELWIHLEQNMDLMASTHTLPTPQRRPILRSADILRDLLSPEERRALNELRTVRNELVHGRLSAQDAVTPDRLRLLEELVHRFDDEAAT
jgi:hypothetical protein